MHVIKTGKTRIVIAFPRMGFVLKVARFSFKGLKKIPVIIWKRMLSPVPKDMRSTSRIASCSSALEFFSLGGVYANTREVFAWITTRSPFLCPTYFSFFGFVNVMPHEKRILTTAEYDSSSFATQLNYYSQLWTHGGHTFEKSHNFSVDENGKVRLIDYGFKFSRLIAKRHVNDLYNNIDLKSSSEEIESLKRGISLNCRTWMLEILKYDP